MVEGAGACVVRTVWRICHGQRAGASSRLRKVAAVDRPAGGRQTLGALTTVLRGSAVPYGYALTVWATHGVLTNEHGNPNVWDVVLFTVGAVAAFAMLGLVAERFGRRSPRPARGDMIRAGTIHIVAIGAAFGAATAIATIPGAIAWALGSFAATALYLSIASVELVVAERIDAERG